MSSADTSTTSQVDDDDYDEDNSSSYDSLFTELRLQS